MLDWGANIEKVQLQIEDSISHTNCGIILFIIYELSGTLYNHVRFRVTN